MSLWSLPLKKEARASLLIPTPEMEEEEKKKKKKVVKVDKAHLG